MTKPIPYTEFEEWFFAAVEREGFRVVARMHDDGKFYPVVNDDRPTG